MFRTRAKANMADVFLETNGSGDKTIRIPVSVRNLSSGVVSLEINHNWSRLEAIALKDQETRLIVWSSDGREPLILKGNVSRFRLANFVKGKAGLDFKLACCDTQTTKMVHDLILHAPRDHKSLWELMDQIQVNSGSSLSRYKVYLVSLFLAIGGLTCYLTGYHVLKIMGGVLWVLSGLLGAGSALRSLRQNRAIN